MSTDGTCSFVFDSAAQELALSYASLLFVALCGFRSCPYLAQTPGAQCSLSLKIQPPLQPTPTGQHPHLPNQVTPNLEPLQHPPDEPQPQTLQPHITTMDTQHSTPSDTDDMTQENPAAPRGRHFDPHREPTIQKPARWNEMSKTQRRHWLRHRLQTK